GLPRLRIAFHLSRSESVECLVIGGMHRDELALEMGREFTDRQAVSDSHTLDLVAIGLRRRSLVEIEQSSVPRRNLDSLISEPRSPTADGLEGIEGRCVARELRQKDPGPFHRRRHAITISVKHV